MSEKIININERRVGENEVPEEELSLPTDVYEANWRDDIVDEAEDETEEETSFIEQLEPYENEREYKSKEIISREAENEIAAFNREAKRKFGSKVLDLYFEGAKHERAA
ncbi:hypothetical protein IKG06_02740 [Candidatus Saccharibacteria bacterium]|nr:hypothetical protein [Candidatus Saccharibacteria bacterium]